MLRFSMPTGRLARWSKPPRGRTIAPAVAFNLPGEAGVATSAASRPAPPAATSAPAASGYMPELDGLRAVAIVGVLVHHWIGVPHLGGEWFPLNAWGALGVRLFFVLSGFLITGILLDARRHGTNRRGAFLVARQFYVRRFLRIVPIYYAVLLVAAWLHFRGVRAGFWWHASYLSNLYFFTLGQWNGPASPFWSLAVEEQFYLLWPWPILFFPRRWLGPLMVSAIVAGPVLLGLAVGASWNRPEVDHSVLLPACLPYFAVGGLLAYLRRPSPRAGAAAITQAPPRPGPASAAAGWARGVAQGFAVVGMPLWVWSQLYPGVWAWPFGLMLALRTLGEALWLGWVVSRAASGFGGPLGWVLSCRPVMYLGRISYGVYVIHAFMPLLMAKAIRRLPFLAPWNEGVPAVFVYVAVTLTLAGLSWHFFERPLNELKRYFPYAGGGRKR